MLFSVRFLFLLCRDDDPPFPLTVNVDSTTISSNASPNAAVKTRQIHTFKTLNYLQHNQFWNVSEQALKHNSAFRVLNTCCSTWARNLVSHPEGGWGRFRTKCKGQCLDPREIMKQEDGEYCIGILLGWLNQWGMRWSVHAERTGEMRVACSISVWKSEGKT